MRDGGSLAALAATMLLLTFATPVTAQTFTELDWASSEPVVALNPTGPGYLILNRSAVAATDAPYAALRALELRNPGFTESAVAEALSFMLESGTIQVGTSGDDFVKNATGYESLNDALRYQLSMLIKSYVKAARLALTDDDIQILVCATCDASSVDLSGVPLVTSSWYQLGATAGTVYKNTDCTDCENPDGSAYCPGQCVSGCETSGSSCQVETVPGGSGVALVDLAQTRLAARQ